MRRFERQPSGSTTGRAPASRRRARWRALPARRGATTIEMAIVLMVFLTLLFGMLDLGIAVYRHHVLAQAARTGARAAIVHGRLADRLLPWGVDSYSGTADLTDAAINEVIRPLLVGLEPSSVAVAVTWPDGGNDPTVGNRVTVTLSAPYTPMMLWIFASEPITLEATSTMLIAH